MLLYRLTGRLILLPLLLLTLCVVAGTALAQEPSILHFESDAVLDEHGQLTVAETLTAIAPKGARGMYREIPFTVRLASGERITTPPTVLSIKVDGQPLPLDDVEVPADGRLRVYMRGAEPLSPGKHTFSLRYSIRHMVGYFETHDELNWNATGNEWPLTIEEAVYRLRLPEGAVPDQTIGWLGISGSVEQAVGIRRDTPDGAVEFVSARPLAPGEGLTCVVSWNKGVIAEPERPDNAVALWLAVGLAVAMWLYFPLVWWRFGKDPARGSIIPQFYPPEAPASAGLPAGTRMSPAAVNYLMNMKSLESRGLVALLLSLATRGEVRVHGDGKTGFSLTAESGSTTPYPEEQAAWTRLQQTGTLTLNKDGGESLQLLRKEVEDILESGYPNVWAMNWGWLLLGLLVPVLGAFACLWLQMGPVDYWPSDVLVQSVLLVLVGLGVGIVPLMVRDIFRSGKWAPALITLACLGALIFVIWIFDMQLYLEYVPPVLFWSLAAAFAASWPFAGFMEAPSVAARKLLDICEGLALYIRTAETERFQYLNPPERTPGLYTRLLPYAVALDLEKAWGENCASILDALNSDMKNSDLFLLTSSESVRGMVHGAEQAVSDYEASKESASSSDGSGGGSGSGGGGGGGGFC